MRVRCSIAVWWWARICLVAGAAAPFVAPLLTPVRSLACAVMGLTAEEKEAKRLAKEAKAAAKAKAKRYKAWCRLLKSKDVGVVQTACTDNARDFEFLRGPGLASLLKLLKNKVRLPACPHPSPARVCVSL